MCVSIHTSCVSVNFGAICSPSEQYCCATCLCLLHSHQCATCTYEWRATHPVCHQGTDTHLQLSAACYYYCCYCCYSFNLLECNRLSNSPLEAAAELRVVASLTRLAVLELGIIYDGASQHADVPRALAGLGDLSGLHELSLPLWRRSLGGRAHPLAPALSAALGRLTSLTQLAVDGRFGHLGVVSSMTGLRSLSSAAPISAVGWQVGVSLQQQQQ